MDIASYKERRKTAIAALTPKMRLRCPSCLQPDFSCYCGQITAFDPGINFVILIHPIEVARRIASGRMAHLFLQNSKLISGHSFNQHPTVNSILTNTENHCVILYPGPLSTNLSEKTLPERRALAPSNKKLTIFVIDGTWSTARKMINLSANLRSLPRWSFVPDRPSAFRIRQQPKAECYSTLEAIHQTIDLLRPDCGQHSQMLVLFEKMIWRQIELTHSKTLTPWEKL